MTEEKLFNPDLRWHPGTGEMTPAQLAAIHTRHAGAIRPIPSATALGHEHLMADADRGALLAELNRTMEEAYRLRAIVEAVKALHRPDDEAFLATQGWAYCLTCVDESHPCETRRAVDQ